MEGLTQYLQRTAIYMLAQNYDQFTRNYIWGAIFETLTEKQDPSDLPLPLLATRARYTEPDGRIPNEIVEIASASYPYRRLIQQLEQQAKGYLEHNNERIHWDLALTMQPMPEPEIAAAPASAYALACYPIAASVAGSADNLSPPTQ
jgi:hypothetical protein